MTAAELQRIKARVTPTICDTWRGEHDGGGQMITVVEGRISADDFLALCAAVESASALIGDATEAMGQAIADERAACAKVAEADTSFDMLQDFGMQSHSAQLRTNIADAIRARATT